jgi:hypothetical protein
MTIDVVLPGVHSREHNLQIKLNIYQIILEAKSVELPTETCAMSLELLKPEIVIHRS